MTLIVETGSIVTNANSYISTTDFQTYLTARGYSITGTAESLLIQAMDYLESLSFIGIKQTKDQALQWPRIGCWVDGYPLNANTVPNDLIKAQCETAYAIDAGIGPLATIPRATVAEKVGPLEVQYSKGAAASDTNIKIRAMLWKLLSKGGNGSNIVPVSKG